jgi:C4-dicarboxylate transporter, DctQ subunit
MIKALDKLCFLLSLLAGLILVFITLSIGYSILTRAIGIRGIVWVVQFNEYALLWMTFLGTAWLVSRDKHVSVHIILERIGKKGRRIFFMIHALTGAFLCGAFCIFTALTALEKIERNVIDVQAVDLPIGYVLAVIPVGFFLLFLQFVRKFAESLRGKNLELSETETL